MKPFQAPPFATSPGQSPGDQALTNEGIRALIRIAQALENGENVFDVWTPVLTFATPGDLAVTYSTQNGEYVKVGRLVAAKFSLITSAFTHTTASGNMRITGLPEAADSAASQGLGVASWQGITKAGFTDFQFVSVASQSYLEAYMSQSGAGRSAVGAGDMPTTGSVILEGMAIYIGAP